MTIQSHRAPIDNSLYVDCVATADRLNAGFDAADVPSESRGYDPTFLSTTIGLPVLATGLAADIARTTSGASVVDYTHFSLMMRTSRRLAAWVAWNIDGALLRELPRGGIDFRTDPRLDAWVQVGNELYSGNRMDRGHIARRADLVWGTAAEAAAANRDSFYYTNIAPQLDDFNQGARQGVWGRLENAVFEDVDVEDLVVSVFGGPVFASDDREYRGVRIPREFWKVVAFVVRGELRARAFLLTQSLDGLEALDLAEFRVFQVPVARIEERTGVLFAAAIHAADFAVIPESVGGPLKSTADIRW